MDPRWLAHLAGYEPRPMMPGERVPTVRKARRLYYFWDAADGRVSGGRVFAAIAEKLLESIRHSAMDAALLAVELAIPDAALRAVGLADLADLCAMQLHVPKWWIEARIAGSRAAGVIERNWETQIRRLDR